MNNRDPSPLLDISDLTVSFGLSGTAKPVIEQLNLQIARGETLVLLGESGSGKSVTALATMGLLPPAGRINAGSITFDGHRLSSYSNAKMRTIRGRRIGMVFQEPMTSLNPVMTIGRQISEAITCGNPRLGRKQVRNRAVELLAKMGIPEPQRRFSEFPHQMSGGMKQRVMIAIALAGEPDLLIADEPTTALDVTTQAQVLELIQQLKQERDMTLLLVTHDFGIAAEMADRVAVMRNGQIVESSTAAAFFAAPQHPYSQQLFAALPDISKRGHPLLASENTRPEPPRQNDRNSNDPILEISGLQVVFKQRSKGFFKPPSANYAVDGVTLTLQAGESLAVVGESGCGKSTVIKGLLQLISADSGSVCFKGQELTGLSQRQLKPLRRHLQVVFQDPYSSLNPRMRVNAIIQEGMIAQNIGGNHQQREQRVIQLLNDVGLDANARHRYPHEFSGGQRQRIGIARALAVEPEVLLLDEPTSALDLSVQAQILDLLSQLQKQRNLAYIFVTHDLSVVEYFADRVAVMYLGRIVEQGAVTELMAAPAHPYTRMLLSAIPGTDLSKADTTTPTQASGEPPSPMNRPTGCHFHPRCPAASARCHEEYPELRYYSPQHTVNCHHPLLPLPEA